LGFLPSTVAMAIVVETVVVVVLFACR